MVVECEVDDLPGEGFGFLMERLLDAGRPGRLLHAGPDEEEPARDADHAALPAPAARGPGRRSCSWNPARSDAVITRAARFEAEREIAEVETAFGTVRVKRARFDGRPLAAAPEFEDCRRLALASGVPWREVYRAALAAAGHSTAGRSRTDDDGIPTAGEPRAAWSWASPATARLRWAAVDLTDVVRGGARPARPRAGRDRGARPLHGRRGAAAPAGDARRRPAWSLEVRGDGPLAPGLRRGRRRRATCAAWWATPQVDVPHRPDGKLAVGGAVGKGFLRVLREHGGGGSYQSQVELVTGEIGDDLAHYLEQSEQTRSRRAARRARASRTASPRPAA